MRRKQRKRQLVQRQSWPYGVGLDCILPCFSRPHTLLSLSLCFPLLFFVSFGMVLCGSSFRLLYQLAFGFIPSNFVGLSLLLTLWSELYVVLS